MRKKIMNFKEKTFDFWKSRSIVQKGVMIGGVIGITALLVLVSVFSAGSNMVPLYRDLSLQEIGQIKAELDSRAVPYELSDGGTTLMVPETEVESLLVDLAALGLPDSGNIDYSFFSENASWGMTDNEFNMIKLDTMQTELANMMMRIEGIKDAKVMINKPPEPVFIGDEKQEATASIVVNTEPGYQFEGKQIQALYHLVSKSVPNLPTENIVIMNQNFEYFDQINNDTLAGSDTYTQQQKIKEDIERDIQRRVQQLLGAMVGMENVIASVTTDIDFTKENRVEELIEPADPETMEGLPVSVERITETYSGNPPVGGEPAGEGDIPGYEGQAEGDGGNYEMVKETINNEFNRITRDIVESPYKIRDIGIQVAIDNSKGINEAGEVQYLSEAEQATVQESVQSILDSIITTSIAKPYGDVESAEKVSIVFQEFANQGNEQAPSSPGIPMWVYIAGGLVLFIVLLLAWMLFRKKDRYEDEEIFEEVYHQEKPPMDIPELEDNKETEETVRRKQLERMAKDKPEDFAKLLRSWIAED
ncbi:flagellar basal-body MS-ring/collar protein FliF [Thalassobacillus pellis]|uniref:flagellar basal-body MS-ring/collar protein FliF n=1 Tax=Thalassobacillus pellis TaxID=748008 RepID=UPI001961DCFC|nr:flagellar basal-body MS-ring/collar protein FliF [Thalassobacillus pellis]MBM7552753.1 flagellar M-ring protein FliF [Thalassobacillus pellis]